MAVSVVERRVGNLPVDVTSFVGRRRELADVKECLTAARLVTLTGMGGVGKTRLALRAAAEVHRGFPHGVWLVELAGVQDAGLVGQTVAVSLGVQDQPAGWSPGLQDRPTGWALGTLAELLEQRQLLLVLDNCEHLLDACAVLADTLLRSCPGLRILATSRQPLGVAGERILPVPPLSVPAKGRRLSPEGLAQYEAVTLFVDRATAVSPGFTISTANQGAVAGICRRLDGIPLAVELAVGRLRALSPDQLLARLDDRYGLLTGGSRAALPRQQTLRALIDWSFELCSPAEQLLWARLSVFAGGFDLEAAEAVCGDGEVPAGSVLDLVSALVDKSILVADSGNGGVRYQLPDTLREYGRVRLRASGGPGELQRRHRDWCRALVARIEAGWFGQEQVDLLALLKIEHANLRVALDYCLTEPGEARVGLEMASALRFYWLISYRLNEGRHWLDRLLATDSEPTPARLKALCVAAYLAALLNDRPDAESRIDEAGLLNRQLDEESAGSAQLTQIRGLLALYRRDPERAVAYFEQALTTHQCLGDQPAAVYDQAQLALAAALLGDDRRAVALLENCISVTEARGEHWVRGLALWALGIESCRQGDYERATISQRQAIRLRLPLDDRLGVTVNMQVLAWAAAGLGDSERAARLFGAVRANAEAIGFMPAALGHLSELHDRHKASARRDLGNAAFDRAFAYGARLGFDDAVDYALGGAGGSADGRPATKRDAAESGTLTRREREIAELIRQGLSNKEIARTLMISQRTAEGHVEHILTKLGFTTRAQVAAWVAEERSGSAGG